MLDIGRQQSCPSPSAVAGCALFPSGSSTSHTAVLAGVVEEVVTAN
jgi:hypothetical protein